ncbi:MAG: efflux RND transporter periplasmic adaptor subunit, partial [candidate division KSB1 bacterium]
MKPINTDTRAEMRRSNFPISRFATIIKRLFSWLLALGLIFVVYKMVVMLRQPPSVEVAEIKQENVARALAITARIRPRYFNRVIPVVSGRLVKLTREEGEAVQQGEGLAQIFDGAARAKVQQAQAAAATQREQLAQARRTYERVQKLNSTGLNSTEEVEQARLSVEQGEKVLHQLEAAIGEAETLLQDYILRAPFSGYVLKRPVDNGQKVGTETVIYEIATADQLDVEAE